MTTKEITQDQYNQVVASVASLQKSMIDYVKEHGSIKGGKKVVYSYDFMNAGHLSVTYDELKKQGHVASRTSLQNILRSVFFSTIHSGDSYILSNNMNIGSPGVSYKLMREPNIQQLYDRAKELTDSNMLKKFYDVDGVVIVNNEESGLEQRLVA